MTTLASPTLDAVLAVLVRGPDGALTLAPGGAAAIQASLSVITDPTRFQHAIAEVLELAGYLGAVRGAPRAARAILRACEALLPRLVAIGALPERPKSDRAEHARVLGLTPQPTRPTRGARPAGPTVEVWALAPRAIVRP